MIRELRKKFILVSMCSMMVVLLGIVGGILFAGYGRMVNRADQVLQMLAENNGEFPHMNPDWNPEENDENQKKEEDKTKPPEKPEGFVFGGRGMALSLEAPYETRYFSVILDEEGKPLEAKTGNIAAVQEETAKEYGTVVWQKEKSAGFYKSYRYFKQSSPVPMIIFVDCTRELENFYGLLGTSIFLALSGWSLVLILVLLLSRKVFQPVAESYEKQKQFITDASHELKTPLTIIDANTEVLELMDGENQWTASIRKQVKRLTQLTKQMVALSRMEEGEKKKELCMLSLSQVMLNAAEPFCQVAEQEGKELSLSIEPDVKGRGDEMLLIQLVSLLLDNALKYSLPESRISFVFGKKGRRAELVVSNETDMVARGNQDILFERFYRTDASRSSETGGSGIGLSIARAIVETHKGRIHANCADGRTIVFTALWER